MCVMTFELRWEEKKDFVVVEMLHKCQDENSWLRGPALDGLGNCHISNRFVSNNQIWVRGPR